MKFRKDVCPYGNHQDCFARQADDTCWALEDTDFGDRDCPFYKSSEQNRREREACDARKAARKGRKA